MSVASITHSASGGFLNKLTSVVSNPDHLVEGTVWTVWFGWTVSELNGALESQQQTVNQESTAQKADLVWHANKNLFLSICACISSSSMLFAWLENVGLLFSGILGPVYAVFGYGGSALGSLVRLGDAFAELYEATKACGRAKDPGVKIDIAIGHFSKMAAVAFYVTAAAWGVFGGAHIMFGGATLAGLVGLSLKYTILSFLAYFGILVVTPLIVNDPKNLMTKKVNEI